MKVSKEPMHKYFVGHTVVMSETTNIYKMSVQNKNRSFNRSIQGEMGLLDSASYLPHPTPSQHTHTHKVDWSSIKII